MQSHHSFTLILIISIVECINFHLRMSSGEDKDVSQAPADEDGSDSGSLLLQTDCNSATCGASETVGEAGESEADKNLPTQSSDTNSEGVDDREEGSEKDVDRTRGHSPQEFSVGLAQSLMDWDSGEEEPSELSPLRDGGGDRIHSPPIALQLVRPENMEVGLKDGEMDDCVGQGALEPHFEMHEEREDLEDEAAPAQAVRGLLNVTDDEGEEEGREDSKDHQEDSTSEVSANSPVASGSGTTPQVFSSHQGDHLDLEESNKRESDSHQTDNSDSDHTSNSDSCHTDKIDSPHTDNSEFDDAEKPAAIVQDILFGVLEKVPAREGNNVENGEDEHQAERPLVSGNDSRVKTGCFPELDKVQLCSDESEHDVDPDMGHSVHKEAVSDDVRNAEVRESAADFHQDQLGSIDQPWHYDAEDCRSNDSVPLVMRIAGSDVEEEELKGESREVYPLDEMAAMQGGDSCHDQGKAADREESGRADGLQVVNMASPKPEYPLNYGNYKVCRLVSPGVKECLILETGEHVICRKRGTVRNPPVTSDASPAGAGSGPNSVGGVSRERSRRKIFADKDTRQVTSKRVPAHSENVSSQRLTASSRAQVSQKPVKHASLAYTTADFDDRESHDGSYLWIPRQGTESTSRTSFSNKLTGTTREMLSKKQSDIGSRPNHNRENVASDFDGRRGGVDGTCDEGSGSLTYVSGSADASGSISSSGVIPNFKTLQDQQLSWLAMYRLLEEQHRGELQAQYAEHQRLISRMQHHLDHELAQQGQAMREKLHAHREALSETHSPDWVRSLPRDSDQSFNSGGHVQSRRQDMSEDSDFIEYYSKPSSSQTRAEQILNTSRSTGHLRGENSLNSSGWGRENLQHSANPSLQRISPASASMRDSQPVSELGRDKLLRGGVYSTPMPVIRTKNATYLPLETNVTSSVGEGTAIEESIATSERWPSDSRAQGEGLQHSREVSISDDDRLSPRSQLSLREKHAKHLADLRAYYEAELQELRGKLTLGVDGRSTFTSLTKTDSIEERILREENHTLRRRCQDLEDALDDANIQSRELQQKLHGLEIRAADYAERYEESQANVLKLKNRLEELHAYAKEREAMLEECQARERRHAFELQELYKVQEEQAENMRRDKAALNRLLDKYEKLEKECNALKDTTADLDKKLFETRSETVDLNKIISRLELENKRLQRDNDNLRHRLSVGGSFSIVGHEVEEMTEPSSDRPHQPASSTSILPSTSQQNRSAERVTARSLIMPEKPQPRPVHVDNNSDVDSSPLLKAEIELRRLQENLSRSNFAPKLQPKKYNSTDSLMSHNGYSDVTIIDALKSPHKAPNFSGAATTATSQRPKAKKQGAENGGASPCKPSTQNLHPNSSSHAVALASPTRFDVGVKPTSSKSSSSKEENMMTKDRDSQRKLLDDRNVSPAAVGVGANSVDTTLDRIRTGEIVSRPQWEDVYTSLARSQQTDSESSLTKTQEEMLRERLRTIETMEQHYDELQMEKRKLESMLNKVPSHGRVDRKSRREKEELENRLEKVDRELGSLRMTLKRFQVLKSSV